MKYTFTQPYALQYDRTGNIRWVYAALVTADVKKRPTCYVREDTISSYAKEAFAPDGCLFSELISLELTSIIRVQTVKYDRYTEIDTAAYRRVMATDDIQQLHGAVIRGTRAPVLLTSNGKPTDTSITQRYVFCAIHSMKDAGERFAAPVYTLDNGVLNAQPQWTGEDVRKLYNAQKTANLASEQSSHTMTHYTDIVTSVQVANQKYKVLTEEQKRAMAAAQLARGTAMPSQKEWKPLDLNGLAIRYGSTYDVSKSSQATARTVVIDAATMADYVALSCCYDARELRVNSDVARLLIRGHDLRSLVFNGAVSELDITEGACWPHEVPQLRPTALQPNVTFCYRLFNNNDDKVFKQHFEALDLRKTLPQCYAITLDIPQWYDSMMLPAAPEFKYILGITRPTTMLTLYSSGMTSALAKGKHERELSLLLSRRESRKVTCLFSEMPALASLDLNIINTVGATNWETYLNASCAQVMLREVPAVEKLHIGLGNMLTVMLQGHKKIKEVRVCMFEAGVAGWVASEDEYYYNDLLKAVTGNITEGGVMHLSIPVEVFVLYAGGSRKRRARCMQNEPPRQHFYFHGGVENIVLDMFFDAGLTTTYVFHVPKGTKAKIIQNTVLTHIRKCKQYTQRTDGLLLYGKLSVNLGGQYSECDSYDMQHYNLMHATDYAAPYVPLNVLHAELLQYWNRQLQQCIVEDI